jgi:HAD superfamily hydrolase (TIGR01450 family)
MPPPLSISRAAGCGNPSASGRGRILANEASDSVERHRALLDSARLVLIDLDGCLAFGNRPHPAAPAFLARHDGRCAILSNNSTETPDGLARILAGHGLVVDPGRIVLAGSLTVDMLATTHAGTRVSLLASAELRAYARAVGLRLTWRQAETVVLARDTSLTYTRFRHAVASLSRGAACIVANPDLTHPGPGQVPVPETGALLAMLRACIPDLTFTVVGKPSRLMFEAALARFGTDAASTVMIGDNPDTDGVGARAAGITPILVGPGQLHTSLGALL